MQSTQTDGVNSSAGNEADNDTTTTTQTGNTVTGAFSVVETEQSSFMTWDTETNQNLTVNDQQVGQDTYSGNESGNEISGNDTTTSSDLSTVTDYELSTQSPLSSSTREVTTSSTSTQASSNDVVGSYSETDKTTATTAVLGNSLNQTQLGTQTGSSGQTTTITTTGNDIAGTYTETETGSTSNNLTDSVVTSLQTDTTVDQSRTSTSAVRTGNDITGDYGQATPATTTEWDYPNVQETVTNQGQTVSTHETGSDTTTASTKGNDLTENYTLTEYSSGTITLVTQETNRTLNVSSTETDTDGSTVTQTGNYLSGSMSSTETGTSTASLVSTETNGALTVKVNPEMTETSSTSSSWVENATYSGGSSETDLDTGTQVGSDSQEKTGDSLTGDYVLMDSSSSVSGTTQTAVRSGVSTTQLQSQGDSASLTQTGNDLSGGYDPDQTDSTSTSLGETASAFTESQVEMAGASVQEIGNAITGDYGQTTNSTDSISLTESAGSSYSLTQTQSTTTDRLESGDSVTGAYSGRELDQDSLSLSDHGTNSHGSFSLGETETSTLQDRDGGNAVTGKYNNQQTATDNYTLQEINTVGSTTAHINETGVVFDSYSETGKAVDGSYKQQDTTLEDYTLTETGASSVTVDGIATGSVQEQASNVQEGTLSITSESTETDAVITTGGTSIDNVSATTTETLNTLTGTTSVSAAASDRYSLLTDYNNPVSSGSPSTAVISEVGLPVVAFSASGASGTAISTAGGGSAANLSGNPSNGYSDEAGRASQLRAGATIVMPAEGAMGGAAAMSQAADLGAELYKQYCFAAETPIRTPTGSKLIKDIVPGDWVLASPEDRADGPIEAKLVEEVFVNETHLWALYVQGEKIRTAGEHRFYVLDKGWINVAGMRQGDLLRSDDGQWMAVEGVEETGDYETVYNFRVADWHTYFVGALEWGWSAWAHNDYSGFLRTMLTEGRISQDDFDILIRDEEGEGARLYKEAVDSVGGEATLLQQARQQHPVIYPVTNPDQILLNTLGDTIVEHNGQRLHTVRIQDHLDGNNQRTALNALGNDLPDTGIVYFLRDRRTGEVLKPGNTSTSWSKIPNSETGRGGMTAVTNRWSHYFSNQRHLNDPSEHNLNTDVEIVYAFSTGDVGQQEIALRTALGGDDPNNLLWDNSGNRLQDINNNNQPITSGPNPHGLPGYNDDIRNNWLGRAQGQGNTY